MGHILWRIRFNILWSIWYGPYHINHIVALWHKLTYLLRPLSSGNMASSNSSDQQMSIPITSLKYQIKTHITGLFKLTKIDIVFQKDREVEVVQSRSTSLDWHKWQLHIRFHWWIDQQWLNHILPSMQDFLRPNLLLVFEMELPKMISVNLIKIRW